MMRLDRSVGYASLFLLAACGGGGSGGGNTTPAMTDDEPEQVVLPDEDEGVDVVADDPDIFPTVLLAAVTGGNTTTPETTSFTQALADIRFDDSYNLRIILTEATGDREIARFTDEDIQSSTDGLRLYQSETAILISSTPEGETLGERLDYTTFGRWREFDSAGIDAFTDGAAFFAGVPTNSLSAMPTTGSATYTGSASGQALAQNRSFVTALSGSMSATADFNANQLDLDFTLTRLSTAEFWGSVDANDLSIAGDSFSGDGVTSSLGHTGSASGRFFGPDAVELGGVIELESDLSVLQVGFGAAQ